MEEEEEEKEDLFGGVWPREKRGGAAPEGRCGQNKITEGRREDVEAPFYRGSKSFSEGGRQVGRLGAREKELGGPVGGGVAGLRGSQVLALAGRYNSSQLVALRD